MRRVWRSLAVVAPAALALALLGTASARTHAGSGYGGTLVVGLSGGDPDSIDPTVSRSGSSIVIYPEMCLRLYQTVSNHGVLQYFPLLAAALPVLSKDKLTATIQLKQGLEFNDGTPFNAQAVVTSSQRMITTPGSSRATDFASIDTMSATGPSTVVYHLKHRDASFLGGNPYVLSPAALQAEGANFATNPVCVGPFMFDHRVVGDNVTLIKSPYYYKRAAIHLDKIVFKPMADAAAAVAALKAGDIQVLDLVDPAAVQQDSDIKVLQSPQLGWKGIVINIGNKNGVGTPYSNVGTPLASSASLREAFEEAINRATMTKILGGTVQPSCTTIPPPSPWYSATKIPCTPFDPQAARKLVAKSGFSNPTVHLLTPNTTANLQLAQFIQAEEGAVGINVVIDSTDGATALALATSGKFDTYMSGFLPGNIDPDGIMAMFVETTGVRNYSGYSNPRLDLVMSNALKATSTTARATLYRVAQQIIANDRPIIYLFNGISNTAFRTNVTGVELMANGGLSLVNAQFK
jgi:peptide/nickel transport system substrate-binding protein